MRFRNILVRATNWLGDAVMSLPALQALRAHLPEARISILARPWVGALYTRESFCDELIPYEPRPGWHDLKTKWQQAVELKHRSFDCAILLQNAFEAAALVWCARVPVRIGYDRDARGLLLTHAVKVPSAQDIPRHQRFYYLELMKRAGLIESYDLSAPIRLAGASPAADKVSGSSPLVGVSPGAAFGSAKQWLPDRFAQAAIQVAKIRGTGVVVLGSKSEAGVCEIVRQQVNAAGVECRNLAGQTSLAEFIEITAACAVMLTNDSGAMHVSSALGVPTVAVFGATDSAATGPTGAVARVIQEKVECSPCKFRVCPIDHRCMTRVPAERVAQTALELLEK